MIRFAEDNATLFKDEFGVPHTLLEIDNHHEVLSVEGKKFEKYLAKLFYEQIGTVATAEGLNSSVRSLSAKAIFDGETIPLHLRLAWTNPQVKDSIYYDLSEKTERCITITKDKGWEIVEDRIDVLFKRFGHQTAQVEPLHDFGSSAFDTFINSLNIKNEKRKLIVKVWIICKIYRRQKKKYLTNVTTATTGNFLQFMNISCIIFHCTTQTHHNQARKEYG